MLGIDVFLHATFLLVLSFIAVTHWMAHGSLAAVASGVGFFVALFVCVLLHEYGHALAARHFGVATKDITLLPIGGVARLERMPEKPIQELWVALAGPAVNVVIAIAIAAWLTLTGSWESVTMLTTTGGGFAERLLAVNVTLVVFNMIPAFPMDGGRVLRAVLAMQMEYARATRIAARIGQGLAAVVGVIGLFSNPFLMLIAVFIWFGASQEAAAADAKASISDLPVREAMLTNFSTLSPRDTLGDATRLLIDGSQQDFPVLDGERVVGVLTHSRLFEMLRERGEWTFVADAMERDFRSLRPDERLDGALFQAEPGLTIMPVVRDGHLVGLLTAENIGELLMIRSARALRPSLPPPLPSTYLSRFVHKR
ncbi:MAG: site-2 protease family protein [Chthoniobacter sp.]|nr:site-2 protease family protein [Chthoniobacter sp.]